MAYRSILIAALLLAGCATEPQRIEVRVPVPVRAVPPPELSASWSPPAVPQFVQPADPAATSALTAEGEGRLRVLLLDAVTRIRAWETWADEKNGLQ